MKKLAVIIAVLMLFATGSVAYAGQFGPPEPVAEEGKVSLGVGYFYYSAKWQPKNTEEEEESKVKQNQVYLQVSYGFIKNAEVYLRVGGADVKAEEFKDDLKPFGTFGVKGIFNIAPFFGIGPFFQASLYSSYKDEFPEDTGTLKAKLKNPWEINLGLGLQGKIGEAVLYGGPVAYWTRTKVDWTWTDGTTESGSFTFKEKRNIGGFAGLRLPLAKGLNVEVEGQLKSKFSFGGALTYSF